MNLTAYKPVLLDGVRKAGNEPVFSGRYGRAVELSGYCEIRVVVLN
jgi:hypothetical protein